MQMFNTKAEANDAGFVRATRGDIHNYRGVVLRSVDVSGSNGSGYAFELQLSIDQGDMIYDKVTLEKLDTLGTLMHKAGVNFSRTERGYAFAKSQQIWLNDELNQVKQPGWFNTVYHEDALKAAIKTAEEVIDAFREVHPE